MSRFDELRAAARTECPLPPAPSELPFFFLPFLFEFMLCKESAFRNDIDAICEQLKINSASDAENNNTLPGMLKDLLVGRFGHLGHTPTQKEMTKVEIASKHKPLLRLIGSTQEPHKREIILKSEHCVFAQAALYSADGMHPGKTEEGALLRAFIALEP
jgi:hypothetical protein